MASALYLNLGTTVTWTDSGGDEVLDLGGLAAGSVRVGAYHDFGADPRPGLYQVEFFIDGFDTAPVVGESVNLYICEAQSSTSIFTGPEAPADTSDGAGSTAKLPNHPVGPLPVFVTTTTAGDNLVKIYTFFSDARYLAPVVHNNTADALLSSGDAHTVKITPWYWESQ